MIFNNYHRDDPVINVGRAALLVTLLASLPLILIPMRDVVVRLWSGWCRGGQEDEDAATQIPHQNGVGTSKMQPVYSTSLLQCSSPPLCSPSVPVSVSASTQHRGGKDGEGSIHNGTHPRTTISPSAAEGMELTSSSLEAEQASPQTVPQGTHQPMSETTPLLSQHDVSQVSDVHLTPPSNSSAQSTAQQQPALSPHPLPRHLQQLRASSSGSYGYRYGYGSSMGGEGLHGGMTVDDEDDEDVNVSSESEEEFDYSGTETSGAATEAPVGGVTLLPLLEAATPPLPLLPHVSLTYLLLFLCLICAAYLRSVATIWSLMGSSAALLIAYILPAICYLRIRRHKRFNRVKIGAWLLLISSVLMLILCSYEAITALFTPHWLQPQSIRSSTDSNDT